AVYFSTSDGSDPRTNGRIYTAVVTQTEDPEYQAKAIRLITASVTTVLIIGLASLVRLFFGSKTHSLPEALLAWLRAIFWSSLILLSCVLMTGRMNPVNIGFNGIEPFSQVGKKAAGLAIAILLHGLFGVIVAWLPYVVGGGLLRLTPFGRSLSMHSLLC